MLKRTMVLALLTLGGGGMGAIAPTQASAAECGTIPGGVALYDISAKNTTCPAGRKVAKQWLKRVIAGDCSRLNCRSRGFRCRAKAPARIHYDVKCQKGARRVNWTISVD